MEQNQFDIKKVQVHRTSEAIIFEIAFAIVAVIVWGIITWMLYRAPDIVPTHFDAFGKPNAYGSPTGIIIPCIVLTIGAVVCMATAYFPRHINMPFKITNIRQVELAIRFSRVMGITFLLIPLSVAYMTSFRRKEPNSRASRMPMVRNICGRQTRSIGVVTPPSSSPSSVPSTTRPIVLMVRSIICHVTVLPATPSSSSSPKVPAR